jgi:divalent metal cation (Fe/Co/Zn/Cd) transporter
MTTDDITAASDPALAARGRLLEWATLGWNVVGVVVLGLLAASTSSVALLGFGLDSLIEIGASVVVIWELSGTGEDRQRRALRLIAIAFIALASYLLVESAIALITQHHASPSAGGIAWTAATAVVMFLLALGKSRTGRVLQKPVLISEGRVTTIDGILAVAVLIGVALDLAFGWWWADSVAALVIVFYAAREAISLLQSTR